MLSFFPFNAGRENAPSYTPYPDTPGPSFYIVVLSRTALRVSVLLGWFEPPPRTRGESLDIHSE